MGAPREEVLSALPSPRTLARGGAWARRIGWSVSALVAAVLLLVAGAWYLGQWLVVNDPLERGASAIVVMGGHPPYRAMEAATLYWQGWAREVWLMQSGPRPERAMFARLAIQVVGEETYNRQIVERLGVRPDAVRVLDVGVRNTAEEVRLVAREVRRMGGDRVILVTSKFHTRRVRATWRALVGSSPRAIVRSATDDPYDGEHWWRRTSDAMLVAYEVFGLLNLRTGFRVEPTSADAEIQ